MDLVAFAFTSVLHCPLRNRFKHPVRVWECGSGRVLSQRTHGFELCFGTRQGNGHRVQDADKSVFSVTIFKELKN